MSKENIRNKQYTDEFKESILKRLELNETVGSLSIELNISKSTIYQWIRTNNKKQKNTVINLKSKDKWTSQDKFHVVIETTSLTEAELAEYCRRKGLYVDEVNSWRKQCMNANTIYIEDTKLIKQTLKEEQQKIKDLQRELNRKDKALAETAALLVLRKKAQAIWGDSEEE